MNVWTVGQKQKTVVERWPLWIGGPWWRFDCTAKEAQKRATSVLLLCYKEWARAGLSQHGILQRLRG